MKFYEKDDKNDNEGDRKHFDFEPSVLARKNRIFFPKKKNNDKNKRRLICNHVFSMILK